ncbi:MAG: hypothetical protein LUD01_04970, partial [Clostridiales bacterium]|nr:hypothetical protein [Clostridiales bacterium]
LKSTIECKSRIYFFIFRYTYVSFSALTIYRYIGIILQKKDVKNAERLHEKKEIYPYTAWQKLLPFHTAQSMVWQTTGFPLKIARPALSAASRLPCRSTWRSFWTSVMRPHE